MQRSKQEIVINALLNGITVKIQDYKVRMFKPGDIVKTVDGIGNATQWWLGIELVEPKGKFLGASGLDNLSFICNEIDKMSLEDMNLILANNVLNSFNKKDRKV